MTPAMNYELAVVILGLAFLAAAALPRFLRGTPISLPMVYVAVGIALPMTFGDTPRIDPVRYGLATERLTELAVIISLMSAGLKIDRPVGWTRWASTWRLLGITMPLSIAALALGGVWLLGLPLAVAILLGAVIAPTDPVLAASVQVGRPGQGQEEESRFGLTSEAGLNDGLAFPFVNLAIVVAAAGVTTDAMTQWLLVDLLWKIAAGVAAGVVIGYGIGVLVFRLCQPGAVGDGFVAIALTLVAYGGAELIHGYGFISVFVAALAFRRYEYDHDYHLALHDFSEQVETLLMAVLLMLFGAAITEGLFLPLDSAGVLLGLGFLLLVRPLAGMLGLAGADATLSQRATMAVFGIRGIGAFYYLAHALNHGQFDEEQARLLWAVAGFIVLASVVLHGTTAARVMRREG